MAHIDDCEQLAGRYAGPVCRDWLRVAQGSTHQQAAGSLYSPRLPLMGGMRADKFAS